MYFPRTYILLKILILYLLFITISILQIDYINYNSSRNNSYKVDNTSKIYLGFRKQYMFDISKHAYTNTLTIFAYSSKFNMFVFKTYKLTRGREHE